MDNDRPTSRKEAAVKMLLGDVESLFDRAEQVTSHFENVNKDFSAELVDLGALMTSLERSISNATDHITYLQDETKKIVSTLKAVPATPAPAESKANAPGMRKLIVAGVLGGLIASCAALGGSALFLRTTFEDARVGKAVNDALPYIDPTTKKKIEDAMQKARS